jgi:hypothetical protein
MSRRAAFREADVARAIRAALKAGLKAGEFDVRTDGDELTILTHPASEALPSDDQDDDAWNRGLAKWRRSA